jgi:hypothetical protein
MFDATKLPTEPCDPAKVGQPESAKADESGFVRAPDGAGYAPNTRPDNPLRGTR